MMLWAAAVAPAQQTAPHLGYIYPAGGRRGTQFEVTIGGQRLDGVTGARVSGTGVQAIIVDYLKPLTPGQIAALRERLKELEEKKLAALKGPPADSATTQPAVRPVWTAADEKLIAEIRRKLERPQRKVGSQGISEIVTLHVIMSPDAQPGQRELRLSTPAGLTNPLIFCVGQLSEFSEKESASADSSAPTLALPAIINGQIMPGGVNRYRFKATKGQRLVMAAMARELIPYIADAVPGWFQASMALYDPKGVELTYADHFHFHPDPVLYCKIPEDGVYTLEIRDSIYRGREDFVYRITVGEIPFITSVFPLGGRAGEPSSVEVRGWNLPSPRLTIDAEDKIPGIIPLSMRILTEPGFLVHGVHEEELRSNRVPFAVDDLPECLEREPNNTPETAQPVTLPIIINGRINQPGDWDVFRFDGKAGQEIVAEVNARRLNSPLDSVLRLTDAVGKQLAFNDDYEDKGSGLLTHYADSYLTAKLPADGVYYIHLGDAQHKGGLEYAYRLRISEPRGDFALRIVPSSVSVRAGASTPVTIYAMRKDGFAEDVKLGLKNAPAGFSLGGAWVPAGVEQVRFTLMAPASAPRDPVNLIIEGSAIVQGRTVIRQAVPADDMMQAFAYRHLVPTSEWKVVVSGRSGPAPAMQIATPGPVKIPCGGTAHVRVNVASSAPAQTIVFEIVEGPEGISIVKSPPGAAASELILQADAGKLKPGTKGNLLINAFSQAAAGDDPGAAPARTPLGMIPAVAFEIVAP